MRSWFLSRYLVIPQYLEFKIPWYDVHQCRPPLMQLLSCLLNTPLSYHIPDTVNVADIVAGSNAGLAATYCAKQLKKPIQVIVPESTPVSVVK